MNAKSLSADICVIGAGSAGLSVAAGAARLGRKVVLIERGRMGGDCLNYGCVPSKALIAAASRAAEIRGVPALGIGSGRAVVDFAAVMAHVRGVIDEIAPHDSVERFEGLGVTVLQAAARFTGPATILAGETEISARRFVIATGSSPRIPPIPGLDSVPYLTNETVFDLRVLPERLLIVGGGPVGVELGQAFARLGAAVAIVEAGSILAGEDPEAASVVRENLSRDGVELYENAPARAVQSREGGIALILDDAVLRGTHLLIAAGRAPNTEGLGLDAAGVRAGPDGIETDKSLRTSNRRIYAAGDAAGGRFTHVAGDHASTIVRGALFKLPARRRDGLAPRVVYCDPEVAAVGAPTDGAEAERLRISRADFSGNDRARTERATAGFVKLAADRRGRLRGASVVGRGAGDLAAFLSYAVERGATLSSLAGMIAAYPTRAEAIKRAAGAAFEPALFSNRTRALIRLLSVLD